MVEKKSKEQALNFLLEEIAKTVGAKRAPTVSSDSRILHDLWVVGDDFLDLLEAIDGAFDMDWEGFDMDTYVPPEPHLGSWKFYVCYLKGIFGAKNLGYKELRIRDFAEAIRKGRWKAK